MVHDAGILADGSTMAVGWIFMAGLGLFCSRSRSLGLCRAPIEQPARNDRFTRDLIAEVGFALHAAGIAAPHQHIDFNAKLVPGTDRPPELGPLDAGKQQKLMLAVGEFDQ